MKHFGRKRILAKYDFSLKEKEMREDIRNAKDANYKALFDEYYQEKNSENSKKIVVLFIMLSSNINLSWKNKIDLYKKGFKENRLFMKRCVLKQGNY